jgi:hypothetical protein
MIERYTMKVAPALSRKEILKHLNEGNDLDEASLARPHAMKARIKLLRELADLKKITGLLQQLSS